MNISKQTILSCLLDYLELKNIPFKKRGKIIMLECVFCRKQPISANIIPNTYLIYCHACRKKYNLIDIVKKVENLTGTEEEILHYLKELLNVKVMTTIDEQSINKELEFYKESGFDLVPVAKNDKKPIEKSWTNKEHKDIEEWKQWIFSNGLNIGLKCGQCSNILILDIDQKPIPEAIKLLMGDVLIQESTNGFHLFYKYDKDFSKTRIDELKIDIETTGGQVVISPSKVKGIRRKIVVLKPIIEMPKELKRFLLDKVTVPRKTMSEEIREDIKTENFKINPEDFKLKNNNLEGCCNSAFLKLGGILRKQLNNQQTGYVLNTLNKHILESPMEQRAINAMVGELEKYSEFDEEDLAHKIIEYLKEVEEVSRNEIAMTIAGTNRGENKKRIDKVLSYLVREGYISKCGSKYNILKKANWKESLIKEGKLIDFKMPYFYDVANFNFGDLLLIGSKNKRGKTVISMNILKQLVQQGKKPYYLSLEAGSRFSQIALQLGLKEGDFYWDFQAEPSKIELEKDSITIVDWLCPLNFAEVDKIFMHFTEQLYKTSGILIVFMQLKSSKGQDNEWFAPNMVSQFPSLSARYIYDNESSGEFGKFVIDVVRDPKLNIKTYELPARYNWNTKELTLIEEIQKNEKEKTNQ